jgi:hypothetical protein
MSTSPSQTTPHPTQWDIPPIRWAFELLLATRPCVRKRAITFSSTPSARLRTSAACALSRAHVSLTVLPPPALRCASSHKCDAAPSPSLLARSVRATVAVEVFHASPSPSRLARSVRATVAVEVFTFLPRGEPRRRGAASNALACRQLPHCRYRKKWVCTEIASLLSRATDVHAWKQRFLDYDLPKAAVSPDPRGHQGASLTTGSETCSVTFQHWGFMLRVHPVP